MILNRQPHDRLLEAVAGRTYGIYNVAGSDHRSVEGAGPVKDTWSVPPVFGDSVEFGEAKVAFVLPAYPAIEKVVKFDGQENPEEGNFVAFAFDDCFTVKPSFVGKELSHALKYKLTPSQWLGISY